LRSQKEVIITAQYKLNRQERLYMFLAWKELKRNKTKYGLIMAILVLVIFLVLFLAGLAKGLSAATSSAIDNSAANYYILDDSSDNLITRSSLTEEQFKKVQAFAREAAAINLQRSAAKKENEETKMDITYMAVQLSSFMMPEVIEGNAVQGENEIVLNNSFKEENLKVGDKLFDAASGLEMTVVGFTEHQMYGHSSIGVISLDTYAKLQEMIKGKQEKTYHAFALSMKNSEENHQQIQEFLASELKGTMVSTKREIISDIPGHAQEQTTILTMLGFLLVISSFIIGVFFYVTTMQKIPQFGVIKALGAKMSFLTKSLLAQVVILSGISMLIGNLLTFTMASFLPASMPFTLTYTDAAFVSALFIVISIFSSVFSIARVGKVDAISAIGGN
jgi:putative ABC transport system permease protein